MRRSARSIVTALTVATCLSGLSAIGTEPTPDEANQPLTRMSHGFCLGLGRQAFTGLLPGLVEIP